MDRTVPDDTGQYWMLNTFLLDFR